MRRSLFSFPNPVNETSARLVATGVVAQCALYLATRWWWLLIPLCYGFAARVASGPRFSPLGLVATKVITPRLAREHRLVAGPPKRFAQGIGLVFSASALIAATMGATTVAVVVISALVAAASLEAFVGFCLGCVIFGRLIAWGLVPDTVCAECADITRRWTMPTAQQAA